MEFDVGIECHEPPEQFTELEGDETRRAAQADDATRFGARLVDGGLCGLRLDEHGNAVAIIFLADLGH